jgi:hypothetical protein
MDDLDLDLDGSVTVVEWGEGLAEGLSADRLEITIGFTGAGAGAGAGVGAGGVAGVGAGGSPDPGGGDEPRTVRISRIGSRWTAAQAQDWTGTQAQQAQEAREPAEPGEANGAGTQAARRA